jgi:hypothetical protein
MISQKGKNKNYLTLLTLSLCEKKKNKQNRYKA